MYPIIWSDLRYQSIHENVNSVELRFKFKDDFVVRNKHYSVCLIETPTMETFEINNKRLYLR